MSLNLFQFVCLYIIVFGILLFLQVVRRGGSAWDGSVAARAQIVAMLLASLAFWKRCHKRGSSTGGYFSSSEYISYYTYCNFFIGGFAGNGISFNITNSFAILFCIFSANNLWLQCYRGIRGSP